MRKNLLHRAAGMLQ